MAYITTEQVANIRKQLKEAFPEVKFGVSRRDYLSVSVTIKAAPFRFTNEDYSQLNEYHPEFYENREKFEQILAIVKGQDWYDRSDSQVDYFDTAYYFSINQGAWDKPFVYTGKEVTHA